MLRTAEELHECFKLSNKMKRKKGFSFVELIIVIVIIGILWIVSVPAYRGIVQAARNISG